MTKYTQLPKDSAVDRDRVIAFRIESHNLTRRLPSGSLLEASAACGIQNTPPGSAALALHARVSDLTPDEVDRSLEVDKTMLQAWSVRQSPYLFPTRDASAFTIGVLPDDEESLRFFILGFVPVLEQVGISATEAVELAASALHEALDGRVLTKREMGAELAKWLPEKLHPWLEPNMFSNYGATLVRPIALQGLFCFAPRTGNEASFVRTDQWLGAPLPKVDLQEARAEIVFRYLHCYGPSTVEHFAEWAGISLDQARRTWQLVEVKLVEVAFEGQRAWLLQEDLSRFSSPTEPAGVRLLPPHDPLILLRDRETLLPEQRLQRQVWRSVHNPGVVLAGGRIVAIWRSQKKGRRLLLTVSSFRPLLRA